MPPPRPLAHRAALTTLLLAALATPIAAHTVLAARASAATVAQLQAADTDARLVGVIPPNTLTHFCVVTGYDLFNQTLATYGKFLGITPPAPGVAGGAQSNGSYLGKPLIGTTLIAFMDLNNRTQMEFLAGDENPSWWRDIYRIKGYEVHHMGYALPPGNQIWPVVTAFSTAGLGEVVQWGRWGTINTPGAGCYVYVDSQLTLGVTVEILASETDCDSIPAQPPA